MRTGANFSGRSALGVYGLNCFWSVCLLALGEFRSANANGIAQMPKKQKQVKRAQDSLRFAGGVLFFHMRSFAGPGISSEKADLCRRAQLAFVLRQGPAA
jgi:hypothetical protein